MPLTLMPQVLIAAPMAKISGAAGTTDLSNLQGLLLRASLYISP